MAWQGGGAQGGETGVAERGAAGTHRARVSSEERDKRSTQKKKEEQNIAQRHAVPMTHIEPYRPPRPTIREPMEGRPAGADDGGVPPKGYLGRLPLFPFFLWF